MPDILAPDFTEAITKQDGKMFDDFIDWTESATRLINSIDGSEWQDAVYENGWGDFSTAFNSAQYRLMGSNRVEIRGVTAGGTIPDSIFTLPEGLMPLKRHLVTTTSNGALARCVINTDGTVAPEVGNTAWFSLDGIIFSLD